MNIFHPLAAQAFGALSPSTHVMARPHLLLPQPFGPTMAVTPFSKQAPSDRKTI